MEIMPFFGGGQKFVLHYQDPPGQACGKSDADALWGSAGGLYGEPTRPRHARARRISLSLMFGIEYRSS